MAEAARPPCSLAGWLGCVVSFAISGSASCRYWTSHWIGTKELREEIASSCIRLQRHLQTSMPRLTPDQLLQELTGAEDLLIVQDLEGV